jgi:hypothetical protein
MSQSPIRFLVTILLVALSAPGFAAETCSVKATLAGKSTTLAHCAAALYGSENSVTLLFSDTPITAAQLDAFQESSQPPEKDAAGKPRTSIHFSFCPGGGKDQINPATVKLVEMSVVIGDSPFAGFQNVYELPKDKGIVNIEKLSGTLKLGGTIAGRITGGRMADEKKYSWEANFDLKLPAKSAFGGQGCGK